MVIAAFAPNLTSKQQEQLLYKSILIAIDGSELSSDALKAGLELAKSLSTAVTVVTVTDRWPLVEAAVQAQTGIDDPEKHYHDIAEREAQLAFDAAKPIEQELGVECQHRHVMDRHPAKGILEAAKDCKADIIVIASHGRTGLKRMLLGSVATEVTTKSEIPVLIVK